MFAYCNNNPVIFADNSGTAAQMCFGYDTINVQSLPWRDASSGGGSSHSQYYGGYNDYEGYSHVEHFMSSLLAYIGNKDPQVVLDAEFLAFYHGVPVFKADFGYGGGLSFIVIILDDDYIFNERGINVLKHEYGHRKHLEDIGIVNYLFTTAIPSLIGAGLANAKLINVDYYSLPWEYVANMYGGVSHTGYTAWADGYGTFFWVGTIVISALTGGI